MRHYAPLTQEQHINALLMDMADTLELMEQDDRGWR